MLAPAARRERAETLLATELRRGLSKVTVLRSSSVVCLGLIFVGSPRTTPRSLCYHPRPMRGPLFPGALPCCIAVHLVKPPHDAVVYQLSRSTSGGCCFDAGGARS